MDNQPLVYILILNWNSPAHAIECVRTVEKLDYSNYRVLFIDNGSLDNSEKILRDHCPPHSLIQTGKNIGYAGGNNRGIAHAAREGADYIWILNPDIRVEPGSLRLMIEAMEKRPELGICGPVIAEHEDGNCREVFGWRLLPETGWEGELNTRPDQPLDYVYGCSMLIKMKLLRDEGLFREEFFMYSEEKELCVRAAKKGWKLKIVESARNTHYHDSRNSRAYFYCCRNAVFISRLERRRRLKTLAYHLETETFLKPLCSGKFREAFFYLRKIVSRKIPALLCGFLTPLGSAPSLAGK